MILSAQSIRKYKPISPFYERTSAFGLTYGLGPAGYDIRVYELILLRPQKFILASSVEHFEMPNTILGVVHDKSTWARKGLAVQNTVIEPGWRGYLTLELTNHSDLNIAILSGSPIAQIIFHWLDQPTDKPYEGKYQDQAAGAQPAIFERYKKET